MKTAINLSSINLSAIKWTKWIAAAALALAAAAFFIPPALNAPRTEGEMTLPALTAPARVIRDQNGTPYIFGEHFHDVIKAQGFVTAQDRLFQMHLTRLLVRGRLSEFFGEKTRDLDISHRVLGFYRAAKTHARLLGARDRKILEAYADGVNAYIQSPETSRPLEFALAGMAPHPWTIEDSLAVMYYMSWGSSADIKSEITSLALLDAVGYEKFMTLFPVHTHPDDDSPPVRAMDNGKTPVEALDAWKDPALRRLASGGLDSLALGSNNWAMSPEKTPGGKPVLCNDPHLDTRMLPTQLYPAGLFGPGFRAAGVTVPGIPCLLIGRNGRVAVGVTNSFADAQDLFIETLDPKNPDHYLEGEASIPFEIVEETLKIKDPESPSGFREKNLVIRLTRRGPVVSGALKGLNAQKVVSMRWAPMETMGPAIGLDYLLLSRSVEDVKKKLAQNAMVHLNYVFADTNGHIAWRTTGKLPVRRRGNGTVPLHVTDGSDNWAGWVPEGKKPGSRDPAQGWVGTANQKPASKDYPGYYSSWLAPRHRYQRMTELLNAPGKASLKDHWGFMQDALNVMARDLSPIFARALIRRPETREMGKILSEWNFVDDMASPAPSIFHETYRRLTRLVFEDDFGKELTDFFLGKNYFWQERLEMMIKSGESPWFDDISTPETTETLPDMIQKAGALARADLSARMGPHPRKWRWGDIHRIEFLNPIRRSGWGKGVLGGGSHPMSGSGNTLARAYFPFDRPGNVVRNSAGLRMLADLSDDEKVWAVIPGGVSGRTFSPHFKDQIPAYMSGETRYWWLSEKKVRENAESELVLRPGLAAGK
ncbi:Penicillin acylase family protein [Candidatus Desulfarcum epimagneticum]|uniref:Penicillin acylase family protein n=1 Tax=uncultured Desulfobacteraceae bacterium TaxID=218296 RepID=A0A484HGF5_9BACT|nr:Penicillin acylase family protein [uncultured Desulfobacteraceae bacterium]